MQISSQQLKDLTETIEDSLQYFCDDQQVSGELAWTVLSALCEAKLAELRGELASV